MKRISGLFLVSVMGGVITLTSYKLFIEKNETSFIKKVSLQQGQESSLRAIPANFATTAVSPLMSTDFTAAAEKTVNTVVHVRNTMYLKENNPFNFLFWGNQRGQDRIYKQQGTGSGVVISPDGYILTSSHVIKNASEIEITLNNRKTYKAEVIGSDSNTDIALIKVVSDNELPYIRLGNSDNLKIGEWVLAVGNPYNLTSTVTAGIVSAKGRNLEEAKSNTIDSFIQTDAAVNPGNSGGALVNIRGELVGINTMIYSETGSYIGYSFAVPSNIAKKVAEDLIEYGNVQKAVLGIEGSEIDKMPEAIKSSTDITEGFYVNHVIEGGGADKAGITAGDIIVKIDVVKISKFSDLKGYLNSKRPGDVVEVVIVRDSKEKKMPVTLIKKNFERIPSLGIEIGNLDKKTIKKTGASYGVKIMNVFNRQFLRYGIKKGYVITHINGRKVRSVESFKKLIADADPYQTIRIEVITDKGEQERYIYGG